MSRPPHKTLAGYQLLRHSGTDGAGGFGLGCLYEAVDAAGNHVSLKLASVEALPEVRVKERNQHPNLVQLVGYWIVNEDGESVDLPAEPQRNALACAGCILVIATDLHAGTRIRDRQQACQAQGHAGIPRQELLGYMEDIASAADFLTMPKYVHGLGIVTLPCDVTADNLDLTAQAARLDDLHSQVYWRVPESGLLGHVYFCNPRYSAPECLEGQRCASSAQYSLAVTYYELRTALLPFANQATSRSELLQIRREGRLDTSALPRRERGPLAKALSANPHERFQSCTDFVRSLRNT